MRKLLLILFCACCIKATSQTLFNVDADSMRFEYFVRIIESNSNYYFYYDTAQVDKLLVTIHAKTQSLSTRRKGGLKSERKLLFSFINIASYININNCYQ